MLKKIYNEALSFPNVVGLSIGTRPDCIDEENARAYRRIFLKRRMLR